MMAKDFLIHLQKKCLRILLCFLLLVSIFIIVYILIGYYAALTPISYLPEIHSNNIRPFKNDSNQIVLKSSGYILLVDEKGDLSIRTIQGDVIMSSLTYYASYEGTNDTWGLDSTAVKLISDTTISIMGKTHLGVLVSILLTAHKNEPKIDIHTTTRYKMNTVVRREALIAGFDVPVCEVYRKNRQVDTDNFDPEYWLQRQGVRFGKGDRSALVYHTPGISSLQFDSKRNLLFINLEYYLDHPYVYFPYQKDGEGKWEDLSTACYAAGAERDNILSIYCSNLPKVIPRIMLVPYGYVAGYVFTEHADGGNIRTHRAVYFGAEDISNIDDAKGGFAGNRIPVTKSVFYANTIKASCSSIRDDPDYPQFLDFLDQLNKTGNYEICLHTSGGVNPDRELVEESIKYMKNRFNTVTWIDHGMYSGKIHRETFVADGLNQNSEHYVADIWEKYDTRYFWSSAVELIRESSRTSLKEGIKKLKLYKASVDFWREYLSTEEIKKLNFFSAFIELLKHYTYKEELNSLKPVKGNAYPTPLYWQHPTRTRSFYSWATDYSIEKEGLWKSNAENHYKMELEQLDKLLIDQGVFLSHGYYIRNRDGYDVTKELNGKIILNPYFERMLEYMARMRDSGSLYITTIRDLLNYWILTENISFKYLPDGTVYVFNNNDKPINGLSLIVNSSNVQVNGKTPIFKRVGNDIVFSFDINAMDSVILKFSPV